MAWAQATQTTTDLTHFRFLAYLAETIFQELLSSWQDASLNKLSAWPGQAWWLGSNLGQPLKATALRNPWFPREELRIHRLRIQKQF